MKSIFPAVLAALACCISCVAVDSGMGGSLIPVDQTYTIYNESENIPAEALSTKMADSLSGYSQSRITIGAIRDSKYGLTTRSSVLTLIPPYDTLDFGNVKAAKFLQFHFAVAFDSTSIGQDRQEYIIQNLKAYALNKAVDPAKSYDSNDCSKSIDVDFSKSIARGNPVVYGADSLSFDFTEEFGRRFLSITQEELDDYDKFVAKYPGIWLSTSAPIGNGGRINMYELQLTYDSSYYSLDGNMATLKLKCDYDYDGKAETDTAFYFMVGLSEKIQMDSLLSNVSSGSYPQYALNLTGHETRKMAGPVTEEICIEGGGGLKPVISALGLKHLAEKIITSKGADPTKVVINKASLVFPFEFPDNYEDMRLYPTTLSPTCRMVQGDTLAVFASLTDASSSDENQGDINRSTLRYEPEITYHLQELLKINESPVSGETATEKEKRKRLLSGQYDIWFIIMAQEESTSSSSSSSSSDMSEYYQYLAYQSYYNSMYGGYGSYGYSGYDSYSNYYSYMLAAMYASSSSSSTSYSSAVDKDRFYKASLNGPAFSDPSLRPKFKITFSVANPTH